MDSYGQFCPVAMAAEIVTRRWTPLVIRELLSGSRRFNDIHRGVPRMSRTLLATRLAELENAGLIERVTTGRDDHPEYLLTQAGEELRPIIVELGFWGKRWVKRELTSEEYDPRLLMWDMQRGIRMDAVPAQPVVVLFRFTDAPAEDSTFWLVLEDGTADLCLTDPGREEDLFVRCTVKRLTEVWMGDARAIDAMADGSLWIGGPSELRRAFPSWLGLSLFAEGHVEA
ncbi:MAG: helix-turn-helix transcriptional regulator [Rhodothermales bacterium]|nr:helix-turn-helix transcriptional regulator [Rhodothermales bacterium]